MVAVLIVVLHLQGRIVPHGFIAAIKDSQVPKLDDRISLWQVLRKNEALANISEGLSARVSGSNRANPTWLTEFHSHMWLLLTSSFQKLGGGRVWGVKTAYRVQSTSRGNASLYYTPSDVDLSIETKK